MYTCVTLLKLVKYKFIIYRSNYAGTWLRIRHVDCGGCCVQMLLLVHERSLQLADQRSWSVVG